MSNNSQSPFSLDELATRSSLDRGEPARSGDDSGLIDLRALGAGRPAAARPLRIAGLDASSAFPLGLPPAEASVSKGNDRSEASRPPRSADRLLVGLLATTALLLGTIVVLLLLFEAPPAGSATGPVATPLVQAPQASSHPDARRSDRVPEAERAGGDPIAQAPAQSAPRALPTAAVRVTPGSSVRPPPPRASSTATVPSVTANGRTASCPCPADDLMCHMRCSVGK